MASSKHCQVLINFNALDLRTIVTLLTVAIRPAHDKMSSSKKPETEDPVRKQEILVREISEDLASSLQRDTDEAASRPYNQDCRLVEFNLSLVSTR